MTIPHLAPSLFCNPPTWSHWCGYALYCEADWRLPASASPSQVSTWCAIAREHWNLENLARARRQNAGRSHRKARTKRARAFPYIEADHGRINFKSGQEKKPYSLTDANFALWQDSENAWGVRLKAQPVRTDFNLSDTGLLELDGSWQRAANLHETPLELQCSGKERNWVR